MIENETLGARHTIPRWRSTRKSIDAGELAPLAPTGIRASHVHARELAQVHIAADFLAKKLAWETTGLVTEAEELVTSALVSGQESDPSVLTAAINVQSNAAARVSLIEYAEAIVHGRAAATDSLDVKEEGQIRREIARRKQLLLMNPRDSWMLVERALLHANIGQVEQSRQLLSRALKISPDDRYVLRSAVRFFVHVGETAFAHEILSKSLRTQADPWLLSAQLATEAAHGGGSRIWRKAKSLLDNDHFSQRDRSELAAEIGTLELGGGSRKQALKFFRLGLADPTENAVAQIEWIGRRARAFDPTEFLPDLKHSDEAQANRAFAVSDWTLALNAAEKWQELEPFSARPAIFGSFVASILSHSIDRGLAIARQGLKSNPQDFTLLNNYVVLCCYGGNLVEAKQGFVKLSELAHSGSFHVTRLATGGLISFREGAFDAGVQSYTSAINEALALRDPILALRAYCFLAREVSLLDAGMAERFSKNIRDTISALERRGIKIPAEVNILLGQIDEARGVAVQLEWGDLSKFTLSDRIQ